MESPKKALFALKDNCFIFDYFKWGSTLITMKIYPQYDEFDRERRKEVKSISISRG